MTIFNKIDNITASIEQMLVIASLGAMVILTSANVILRTLYSYAGMQWAGNLLVKVEWSEPFGRQMVLWVAFLGASLLTRNNKHIRIEIPGIMSSLFWSCIRDMVLSTACALICAFLIKASADYLIMEIQYSSARLAGIPVWFFQLIIPIGFTLMFFRFLSNSLKNLFLLFPGRPK